MVVSSLMFVMNMLFPDGVFFFFFLVKMVQEQQESNTRKSRNQQTVEGKPKQYSQENNKEHSTGKRKTTET